MSGGDDPLISTWRPTFPVDLLRTLAPLRRGRGDPCLRLSADEAWRVATTPQGPVTLYLRRRAGEVESTAWGPGAEWMTAQVPALLGDGDDWSALDLSAVPVLARTLRELPGLRIPRTGLVWESLAPAVLEQKVVGLDAWQSYRQLIRRFGSPAPGPAPEGMRLLPTAEQWRVVPSWEFHRAGVDPQRAATAMRAARVAPALERTVALGRGGPEVRRRLQSVPGIGPWTTAETVQRAHGDPDMVSVGDFHLAHVVGTVFTGRRTDDAGMLELLAPWEGQRHRVVRVIEFCGITKERFGPRMSRVDHRSI